MKKILFVITCILFLLNPSPVSASQETAHSAAELVANSTDISALKPDTRANKLKAYLESYAPRIQSPLTVEVEHIISEADKYDVDWRLIVAIAGVESTFCEHIPANSFNCWGWGIPTGAQSGIGFANLKEGITAVSKGIREKYLDRGLTSYEAMGRVYAASPSWSRNVNFFLNKIDNFEAVSIDSTEITL